MRLYLDCCCYNRLFDDQNQPRIHEEAEAVKQVIESAKANDSILVGSDVLSMEVSRISDKERRDGILRLMERIDVSVPLDDMVQSRGLFLQGISAMHLMDSLHIASAEAGTADVFLTVDDRLYRMCQKIPLTVEVMNPTQFRRERLC